ncbi:MAG TPA: penicillin-binding protein 2 [Streptosporangiaceae bacterium]
MRRPLRRTSSTRRLNATLFSVAIAMCLILARLVQLQGVDASRYRYLSQHERGKLITEHIPAVRGEIVSSDGTVLAMTVRTDTVYADPTQIVSPATPAGVAAKLTGLLRMTQSAIVAKLEHPSSPAYVVLKSGVVASTADAIARLNLPGIAMQPTYQRAYPNHDLAAPLVGFVNTNPGSGVMTGEAGLEEQYNPLLAGKPGTEVYQAGVSGLPIPGTQSAIRPVVSAGSLRLTIRADIQWKAEQECALEVAASKARTCTVVVMEPRTGQILAFAQYPTYDPASVATLASTTDVAVQNMFAPGSTAKVITAAAAFQDAGLTPLSSYVVPDSFMWHRAWYHDAESHPTQRYTIAGIIAHSLNDGMVQVADHVTPAEQYKMFRTFGIGSPSGLNLPGEAPGILAPPAQWTGGNRNTRYQISFGQSVAVTAIQMASVYATIANNGVRVTPSIVAGHTTGKGRYVPAPKPASRRVTSAKTAAELMAVLEQVPVTYNQAGESWGMIPGYTVAAKTGTAQEPGKNWYGSSFIGIAPASSAGLVVAVNVQDPRRGSYFGIDVAGPVFNAVMKFALATMKIPPDGGRVPYVPLTAP